jgi:hypothetical protein
MEPAAIGGCSEDKGWIISLPVVISSTARNPYYDTVDILFDEEGNTSFPEKRTRY